MKRPVHDFGVVHAFGGRGALASLSSAVVEATVDSVALLSSMFLLGEAGCCGITSLACLGDSLGFVLEMTGTMGTTGTFERAEALDATGVVSPATLVEGCTAEDGVVGFVESNSSDAGWLVEGVSGRPAVTASDPAESTLVLALCWMLGSSTGSDASGVDGFFLRRTRLAGQEASGLENQGSCV